MKRIRLACITATPETQWGLLRGQNAYLKSRGFELHAICSPGARLSTLAERDGVTPHPVYISRQIRPISDFMSLMRLFFVLRRVRPDIVHVSTPKAAFLGALAGWLARVPVRVYLVRGLATDKERGRRRSLFRSLEWLTARLCHSAVCVSPSLLVFARAQGILAADQGVVLGNGMSNGIDADRFDPRQVEPAAEVRPSNLARRTGRERTTVIGFVGRLALDKGLHEIADVWKIIADEFPDTVLLLVGPWETESPICTDVRRQLETDPRVIFTGNVEDVECYYKVMDLLLFPTHAEGFPNAPMEAASMEVPVVATRVNGCVDAVEHGVTGHLVAPRSVPELTEAVRMYLTQPELRQQHGQNARARVIRSFRQKTIWDAIYQHYISLLQTHQPHTQFSIAAAEGVDFIDTSNAHVQQINGKSHSVAQSHTGCSR